MRVGALPIAGAAPLTLAIEEGLFVAAGLTVSVEPVQSGAIALPALVAGDLDILFGNHVSTIAARAKRLDVVIIAEASRAQPDNFAVVTQPDSASPGPEASTACPPGRPGCDPLPQHHDAAGRDIFPTVHLDRSYDSRCCVRTSMSGAVSRGVNLTSPRRSRSTRQTALRTQ